MRHTTFQRGFSLLGVVAALLTLTLGLSYYAQSILGNRKVVKKLEQGNVAENFAAELMETFLSISNDQLASYLAAVPGVPGTPGYPLCAHINILDRANTTGTSGPVYFNRDPLADLPPGSYIDNRRSPDLSANRFYQVQVVNAGTLAPTAAACGLVPSTAGGPCGVSGPRYKLCSTERFMVTVGVSFVPLGKDVASARRIVLTSILPET